MPKRKGQSPATPEPQLPAIRPAGTSAAPDAGPALPVVPGATDARNRDTGSRSTDGAGRAAEGPGELCGRVRPLQLDAEFRPRIIIVDARMLIELLAGKAVMDAAPGVCLVPGTDLPDLIEVVKCAAKLRPKRRRRR